MEEGAAGDGYDLGKVEGVGFAANLVVPVHFSQIAVDGQAEGRQVFRRMFKLDEPLVGRQAVEQGSLLVRALDSIKLMFR